MTLSPDPLTEPAATEISRLWSLALRDELTGVANRRAFLERMEAAFSRSALGGPGFSLMLLDLDGLKDINDTFGHQAGNRALQEFAIALLKTAGDLDAVARIGGDEFAVLVTDANAAQTAVLVDRLRDLARGLVRTIKQDSPDVLLSAAIGLGSWTAASRSVDDLFAVAEAELLTAKAAPPSEPVPGVFRPRGRRALGEELRNLLGVARQVTTSQGLNDLLRRMTEQASALVGAEIAAVAMVRDDGSVRYDEVWHNGGWQPHVSERPLGEGMIGRTALTGDPELHNDRDPHDFYDQSAAEKLGLRSVICVPLRDRHGATFGVLSLGNKRGGQSFVDADVHLAQAFADLAASAIENVRSFEATEEARAYQRALMEQAADAILLVDGDGGRILDANPAAAELTGRDRETLIGISAREVVGRRDGPGLRQMLATLAMEDSGTQRRTFRVRHADGRLLSAHVNGSRVTVNGRPAMMLILRDVTAEQSAERQRERLLRRVAEEAERSQQLLELAHHLAQAHQPEAVIRTSLDACCRLAGAGRAAILRWDSSRESIVVADVVGLSERLLAQTKAMSIGPVTPAVADVLRSDKPVVIRDARIDPRLPPILVEVFQIRAVAVISLRAGGQLLGLLGADRPVRDQQFSRREIAILTGIARQTAIALVAAYSGQQVAETRDYLEAVMRHAGDGIVVTDAASGLIVDVNDELCRLLGLGRSDLIGTPALSHVAPDQRDEVARTFPIVGAAGMTAPLRRDLLAGDGSHIPVEVSNSRVHAGGREMIIGVARDLRSRFEAERQLRFQARVLATMRDAVVALDRAGRVVVWNQGAEDLFGWTEAEMLGTLAQDSVTGGGLPYLESLVSHLNDEPVASGEVPFERKSGTRMWCHVRLTRMVDEQGESSGLIGIVRDVTAEHEARAARAEMLEQLMAARAIAAQRGTKLSVLADVAGLLVAEVAPDTLLATLARRILEGGPFDLATISIYDAEQRSLCLTEVQHRLSYEPTALLRHRGMPLPATGLPLLRRMLSGPGPLVIHENDHLWQSSTVTHAIARNDRLRLIVALPLIYGGEVIGTLVLYAREDWDVPREELRVLQALADQVAVGVHSVINADRQDGIVRDTTT